MRRALPVLNQGVTSRGLLPSGGREFIVPADVSGRFARLRTLLFALLMVIYVALPSVELGGHPAVLLDIEHRAFYLFGATFNAQDSWLVFFLLSGAGFSLILLTALFGRVWCGYACPQTVFLDGLYRRIERLIEGPRNLRIKRDKGPVSAQRVARKVVKHALFMLLSFGLAHVFTSYFTSVPRLYAMMQASPAEHPEAFLWAFTLTALLYGNFAWFREQLCLIVCPYGRLQSALTDDDTLVIGYDERRGEPRGKLRSQAGDARGDCVDCQRCVVVCPTGIDIRNGLQMECIGCAACIDACDEVMDKVGRRRGLIRYDSQRGLAGLARRFLRPRVYVYALLGALGLAVASVSAARRTPFEANLLRLGEAPFVLEASGTRVRNSLELHLVNKRPERTTYRIAPVPGEALEYVVALPVLTLSALGEQRIPLFVHGPNDGKARHVRVRIDDGTSERLVEGRFVAP